MKELTIGQVAKRAGVNIQTVYFYERRKLVRPVKRRETAVSHPGYRIYSEEEVRRIRFIKNGQELGFSLKEIEDLLHLRIQTKSQCRHVQMKAVKKLEAIQNKIEQLKKLKRVLGDLLRICKNRKTTHGCPILTSIQEGGDSR